MILKGSQRKDGRALARHLKDSSDNDHVEIHEVKGLSSADLMQAFVEVEAISKATRCQKPFYSLSFNPPVLLGTEEFEIAIDFVETSLGLTGQPRAIVFHEKQGRRHAHVVWSRITEDLKVVNIAFDHYRLRDASRALFLQHGWDMPAGLEASENSSETNFSHAEWMQYKRTGIHPARRKAEIGQIYRQNQHESATVLMEQFAGQGYFLCRGRRSVLAVDMLSGEHYALNRCVHLKVKDIRAIFSDQDLPELSETQERVKAVLDHSSVIGVFDLFDRLDHQELSPLLWKRKTLLAKQKRLRDEFHKKWQAKKIKTQANHALALKESLTSLFSVAASPAPLIAYRSVLKRRFKEKSVKDYQHRKKEYDVLLKAQLEERDALVKQIERIKKNHAQKKDQRRVRFAQLLQHDVGKLSEDKDKLFHYLNETDLIEGVKPPLPLAPKAKK